MGLLSALYNASFDAVPFMEQTQNGFYPGRTIPTSGTPYDMGGGSSTFVDMGQGAETWTISVGVEAAQLTALEGKRGGSGTLVWSRGSQTATLLDVARTPGMAGPLDGYTVTLRLFSDDLPAGIAPNTAWLTQSGDTWIGQTGDTWIQQ